SKRRRQRIMNEEIVDVEGLDPVVVENDKASVERQYSELRELYSNLEQRLEAIPEGLVPVLKQPEAQPNGHKEESSIPGVQIGDKVASGESRPQESGETAPPPEPDSTRSSPL